MDKSRSLYPFPSFICEVHIVATPFSPSAITSFFPRKSFVPVIHVEIQNFRNLHGVHDPLACVLGTVSEYPITLLHAESLMILSAGRKRAESPKWIRGESAVDGDYIRTKAHRIYSEAQAEIRQAP